MGRRLSRLLRELAGVLDQGLVVGGQHAAVGGGHDLVAVEREHRRPGPASGVPPLVGRAHRLGAVADHRHTVRFAQGDDAVEIAALAVEIGGDDRFGQPPGARRSAQGLLQQIRIQRPGRLVAIEEHRGGALVHHGSDRADEGEARGPDLVAGADVEVAQGEVGGGRAAGQGDRMGKAGVGLERRLEARQRRADRGDVVRLERGAHLLQFEAAEVRGREEQALARPSFAHRNAAVGRATPVEETRGVRRFAPPWAGRDCRRRSSRAGHPSSPPRPCRSSRLCR